MVLLNYTKKNEMDTLLIIILNDYTLRGVFASRSKINNIKRDDYLYLCMTYFYCHIPDLFLIYTIYENVSKFSLNKP